MSRIHWVVRGVGTPKDRDETRLRVERFESLRGESVIVMSHFKIN